ncbi:DMT family transporter [Pedobacter arcticus]|uniref:DMT family transporter n=1 Tax=Pedobacter arcticus TaxID=752140 RepID=UPI0002D861DB|nr:DMT family transporter [Pedobacter arcticus]
MIYIVIAVICSVIVSINFKLFKRYDTNAYQAIVFNYPTAALLCYFGFKPDLSIAPTLNEWALFAIVAGLLLSIFYFIGKSIATSGIVLTAIAQRLSLVIPVLSAFLIFSETTTTLKLLGLVIGFLALYASKPNGKTDLQQSTTWYPIIVFLGTGVLDILFNLLTKLQFISFTGSLFYIFVIATFFGFSSLLYQYQKGMLKFQTKAALAGVVLGFFNFGSIYFYIKALNLESHRPSVVFSSLDIGVIFLGSLVGILLFKEKLTKLNIIGFILALVAIIILNLADVV